MKHGARRGRLTRCDAAPSGGEGRRRRGSVSGDAIRRGHGKTRMARRAARPAHGVQQLQQPVQVGGLLGQV